MTDVCMKNNEHFPHGHCCCNCKFSHPIGKHPWNVEPFKGSISEKFGRVCAVAISMYNEDEDSEEDRMLTFMSKEHGLCELWISREEKEDSV